jgi:predicted kinase
VKVIVGIGVPGCGKTTYLKPLAQKLGLAYINSDDIREELTGSPADHGQETEVWGLVHRRIKDALQVKGAVIDATYSKKIDRVQLIKYCKVNGAKEIIAYWFNLPLETCLERNRQRDRIVPEIAVNKMYNRLTLSPPTLDEGYSEIIEVKK